MSATGHPSLFSPARFCAAIDRLARRRAASPTLLSLQQDGVSLAAIRRKKQRFSKLLVRDLLAGNSDASPGRAYSIRTEGKLRTLYAFPVVELIIQAAVSGWLAEMSQSHYSPRLYSYRSGVAYHAAVRDLAVYVRAYRRKVPDPRRCGLYVLRRDVRSYFDSIPTGDGSPLWRILGELLGSVLEDPPTRQLLERVIRPVVFDSRDERQLERGIATGSPVANVVANLYLCELDKALSGVSGGFFARYGDDIVAVHPEAGAAHDMGQMLALHLGGAGLCSNADKALDIYLTAAGRRSRSVPAAPPATAVEFLGHRVNALGTVSLSADKTRKLLRDVRQRALQAATSGGGCGDEQEALRRAVVAVNRSLNPRTVVAHPYARMLRDAMTDRGYLKWLDHEVALAVLEAGLGRRTVRDFRRYPPRILRECLGLISLTHARNRVGRHIFP